MSLFSTTLKVPVTVLSEAADQILSFADENADIFERICNSLLCLKGSNEWKGKSLEAAVEATEKNKKTFKATISEMEALGNFLKDFSTEMAAEDENIRQKINSI